MTKIMKTKINDPTATKRTALFKKKLIESGGKRMSLNLNKNQVKRLNKLVKLGYGKDQSDVIRNLIDKA